MYLLDTNVVSELMKRSPARQVVSWVSSQPATSLFTSSICQAEILLGLALLPGGRRRAALETAAAQMFAEDFSGRVLPFDGAAAREFATIAARRRRLGRPIAHADAQIAAIVRSRGATLASRNVKDFDRVDIDVLDPWAV